MAAIRAGGECCKCEFVLAADEYQRLKRRDRVVFKTEALSSAEIVAITEGGMEPRHDHLDAELD